METPQRLFPHWMRGLLLAAAAYNILWGVFIGWFPQPFFQWVAETEAVAPSIIRWQGRGVLAMALVYLLCAIHPGKLWFLAAFGALTKLLGALWFYQVVLEQFLGKKALFHLIMNDLVWVPLLFWISIRAYQYKKEKT